MSTDSIIHVLLNTVLPCVVVSFVVGWFLRKTSYSALAVFCGIVAGNVASSLLPWWPSSQEMSSLMLMVFLSFFLIDMKPRHWWVGLIFVLAFSTHLLNPQPDEKFFRLISTVVTVMLYMALLLAERKLPGRAILLLCSLWGLAASIILILAHSGLLSQIALLWACSCIGLYGVFCKRIEPVRGLAGPATIVLQYVLSYGLQTCYSQVPAVAFVLAIIAPVSCLLLYRESNNPRLRLFAVLGWLLLLVIACGLAIYFDDVLVLD